MKYHIDQDAMPHHDELCSLFEKHDADVKPPFSERYESIEDTVTAYAEGTNLVYATDDERIVGILIIDPEGERATISEHCPCPYVNLALVNRAYRGQGVGTTLLQDAIEYYQSSATKLCLRTRGDNKAMQHVCEKLGFAQEGRTHDNGYERLYYCYSLEGL